MAQDEFIIDLDGQELGADDLRVISKSASRAEDQVFAEILRLAPFNSVATLGCAGTAASGVQRCVVPFGYPDGLHSAGTCYGLIQAIGASSVRVMPFRAIVGTRTAVAVDVAGSYPPQYPRLDTYSDIRSAICAFSDDGVSFGTTVAPAANASSNPRFDVVYCEFTLDVRGATDTREVKPPGGGFGPVSVSPLSTQGPIVGPAASVIKIVTGTPSATPTVPAIPADSGSTYRIALATVFIQGNFLQPGTAITPNNLLITAPIVPMSERSTGARMCRPATINTKLNTSALNAWASSGNRPKWAVPNSMQGGRQIFLPMDISDTGTFFDTAVVDDSIDWRFRYFRWNLLHITNGAPAKFFFSHTAASGAFGDQSIPNSLPVNQGTPTAQFYVWGAGQSGIADDTTYAVPAGPNRNGALVVNLDNTVLSAWFSTTKRLGIYVDMGTGALRLLLQGAPVLTGVFLEINASGQYDHPF